MQRSIVVYYAKNFETSGITYCDFLYFVIIILSNSI